MAQPVVGEMEMHSFASLATLQTPFHSLCVYSVSVQRAAEKSSALIQLNTDIMLLASLFLHASIAEITTQLLSLSYVYLIS